MHSSVLMAHATATLAHVSLKHVAGFLLPYFPPRKLEKSVFQGRAAQADAGYPGAEFPDENGQELFSVGYFKGEFTTILPGVGLIAALDFFSGFVIIIGLYGDNVFAYHTF